MRHSENIIYETMDEDRARLSLGLHGSRPLLIIGANPSKATPEKYDATITRVSRFSEKWGYDGWIMLNLYPQRATLPENLHAKPREDYLEANFASILHYCQTYPEATIWASWGGVIELRSYLHDCLRQILDLPGIRQRKWIAAGAPTAKGHPRHPSRLAYSTPITSFVFS